MSSVSIIFYTLIGGVIMAKVYSKMRDELLIMIDNLREAHGEELKIQMFYLNQGNSYNMFVSKMTIGASYSLLRRIPRDYDNPEGIQRALKDKKVSSITAAALSDKEKYSSPNAVVVTLKGNECKFARIVSDPNNSQIAYYIIDLNDYYDFVRDAQVDEDNYLLNEGEVFLGTLIDGHHRTAGLLEAHKINFEVPVTIYIDIPHKDTARVFSGINENQEKPSPVHTLAMQAIAGTLARNVERANQLMNKLNAQDGSILKDRIKAIDGKRPKNLPKHYITSSTFVKLLDKYVMDLVVGLNSDEQTRILNNYFKAWSNVFPEAWQDTSDHVLVKSMGFQIMIRLFERIYEAVYHDGVIAVEIFEEFIRDTIGNGAILNLDDEQKYPINWESSIYGAYSSGKGINAISTALSRHISRTRRQLYA